MLRVELIAVGTELLLGQLVDTNTAHVASELARAGIDVFATHTVGDNIQRIGASIAASLDRADGVIMTGGLGPTIDDLTKEAVCAAFGLDTVRDEETLRAMERVFATLGREMRENNRKQADIPRGAFILENPYGTAPGFVAFRADGKFAACMPGVPGEMKPMLAERLLPFLIDRFALHAGITTRVLHTINISESEIDHRIAELFRDGENPKIAVLAHGGRCDVKIMAKAASREAAEALIAPVQAEIASRLAGHIFGEDDETLESAVLSLLRRHGLSVAAAESCTGGRVSAALTAVPGSSESFLGGIVAYDNRVKIEQLGVPEQTIARHGAVSEETAAAMAEGVCRALRTDAGVSTTGVAGPGGGSPEKPVGLVWFGVFLDGRTTTRAIQMRGDRGTIQARATTFALGMLWARLRDVMLMSDTRAETL